MKEKSITIHGISSDLNIRIQKKSKELHLSQNKTVKKILESSLVEENQKKNGELDEFFGIWSEGDFKEFMECIGDERVINEEDWK